MTFVRPSLTELIDRVIADISSRVVGGEGKVLRRSALGILAKAVSGGFHLLHGHLDWISKQTLLDTCDDNNVKRHASHYNMTQKSATYAAGSIDFTGTDGSVILAGTTVQRSDSLEFSVDTDTTIVSGTAKVAVTCLSIGSEGNSNATTVLSLLSPLAGVNSDAVVDGSGITNGVDPEDIEVLRARTKDRKQKPARGGNEADYIFWAKERPGVTRAWCFDAYGGAGNVGICFVTDAEASIIPDAAKIDEVRDHINSVRPLGILGIVVFAPTPITVSLTIKLAPNTISVQNAVTAEIKDLLLRMSEPGVDIPLSKIREAISVANGENDNDIVSTTPAAIGNAIPIGNEGIAILGIITWQTI